MSQPDYQGGSIVNLMASLILGLGGVPHAYAPLRALKPGRLQRYRTVVLLVIDGLGHQYLTRAGASPVRRNLIVRCETFYRQASNYWRLPGTSNHSPSFWRKDRFC